MNPKALFKWYFGSVLCEKFFFHFYPNYRHFCPHIEIKSLRGSIYDQLRTDEQIFCFQVKLMVIKAPTKGFLKFSKITQFLSAFLCSFCSLNIEPNYSKNSFWPSREFLKKLANDV